MGIFGFAERKAEWLGNDNRKTMIKVKTTGQILPFKSGTALPSPSQAHGYVSYVVCVCAGQIHMDCNVTSLNLFSLDLISLIKNFIKFS